MANDLPTIMYAFAAIVYLFLSIYMEKRYTHNRIIGDEEYLTRLAHSMECSEYDLFFRSAEYWNISNQHKIEGDFKDYLQRGYLPYYVKDFLRKYKSAGDHRQMK